MKTKWRQLIYIVLLVVAFIFLTFIVLNSRSPEALMNPPHASGEYKDIQEIIEKTTENDIIFKAPNSGEYTTAITFMDLNADHENDAVAFYRFASDDTSSIYMSVLIKNENSWTACKPIKGRGDDVAEFSYGDMDYDSLPEIAVGWGMFDSKDNNTLSVYSVSTSKKAVKVTDNDNLIYTKMYVADVCGEGKNEILLVKNAYNEQNSSATATIYELEDKKLHAVSSVNLLNSVMEYRQMQKQVINKTNVFFLDGVVNKDSMVTEIIYWNSKTEHLVSPTYNDGYLPETYRKGTVCSMDINDDGVTEIPFSTGEDGTYISLTSWRQFGFGEYKEVLTGVCRDGLVFNFPKEWRGKVAVENTGNEWIFYDVSEYERVKLFELVAVNIADWEKYSNNDYDKIRIDYGTIYGVKFSDGKSSLKMSKDEIDKCIVNH